jgi:predicted RNA-binding protein with EMAP domain
MAIEEAAHDQPVVYEEGRSGNHPEADALVHVQLTCGLADYTVNHVLQHCRFDDYVLWAYLPSRPDFRGFWPPLIQA